MKYLFLILLIASCSGPSFKSTEVCDTLLLRIVTNRLHNDSVANAIQINYLKAQIDTLNYQLEYVNFKADTALILVGNIDKKALRWYNAGYAIGGIADGITGGKFSTAANIFRRKK